MAALRCIGIGLITTGIGTISAAVNLLVTILTLRVPDMTLRRLSLFVWMVMLNSVLLLAMSALNASIAMLLFDRLLSAHFFDVPAGCGFSRRPIFGYGFVAGATGAIVFLSLVVWGHHMFTVGMGHPLDILFSVGSFLIAVATGIKVFNWTATTWGGSIRYTTAMLFAPAFAVQFAIGGVTGVMFAAFRWLGRWKISTSWWRTCTTC